MQIEELKDQDSPEIVYEEKKLVDENEKSGIGLIDAKKVAVGVGARVLFYPTLVYNVVRNKFQAEFRWWDLVDEYLLLGAVPFPSDVPYLKELGVCGVITLNQPYETLVPSSLYHAAGIEHLVLPTVDYCYAPRLEDICKAVAFIHENASAKKSTYVHCKAGRGRSTTIVLCYLVRHKKMSPIQAYEHVKQIRPRVLLAPLQRKAVEYYYHLLVKKTVLPSSYVYPVMKQPATLVTLNGNVMKFDESSFVIVSKSDLDGYTPNNCKATNNSSSSSIWELSLVYRVQFAGQAALASLSCLWLGYRTSNNNGITGNNETGNMVARESSCSLEADKVGMGHPCIVSGVVINL